MRMLRDKVKTLDGILNFVDSYNKRLGPDGEASILRMRNRHGRLLLGWVFEEFFNLFNLISKELVDPFSCFLLNIILNHGTLGQRVEVLQHLNCVRNSRNALESQCDNVLIDNFKVLDLLLKDLTVVIMPFGDFYIEEVITKVLDVLKVLLEDTLKFNEVLCNFRALGTSKDWHLDFGALSCELELTLANFLKILATLNESLVFSENSLIGVESPELFAG